MIVPLLLAFSLSTGPSCCRKMVALSMDPAFVALHPTPVQDDFIPLYGHMGTVANAPAFIVPASDSSHSAVIMIHEFWGLNNQIKETAEKLHHDTGYGVVAVDLYNGKIGATAPEAAKLMQAVDENQATQQLHDTLVAILRDHLLGDRVSKVGTIGYCFGGGWSLRTAIMNGKGISGCVMYYGHPVTDPAELKDLNAPVLGIFGNLDKGITPEMVTKFQEAMKAAHKKITVFRYDAVHGFANPSNPKHDPKATADAWKHTLAFYKQTLN